MTTGRPELDHIAALVDAYQRVADVRLRDAVICSARQVMLEDYWSTVICPDSKLAVDVLLTNMGIAVRDR